MTASYSGNENSGFYLSSIGNFTVGGTTYTSFGEFDAGTGSGWMITHNDWFIDKGASEFYVKDGDSIEWQYTCQLGADIGDTYSKEAVENVEKLIGAIGTVTLDSEVAILAARNAYDELTPVQQAQVENYGILTAAETALAALKATEADKEAAKTVIDLINAIGTVTLDSEDKINDARTAYEALTDIQKALVENLDILVTAENVLETLKAASAGDAYKSTGKYLKDLAEKYGLVVGSTGGEWIVIGLERAGISIPDVEAYYKEVVKFVRAEINDKELTLQYGTDEIKMKFAGYLQIS